MSPERSVTHVSGTDNEIDGRGERIRTSDPLVPNQVLYQAEPLPEQRETAADAGGR